MKKIGKLLHTFYWVITFLALVFSLTVATYAWFTSNRTVTTNVATAKTGTQDIELQISEKGGGAFTSVNEASIVQVNQAKADYLLPVSTNNLKNFVYNPSTVEGQARSFSLVQEEEYYYHGRIFLRAKAEGMPQGTRLALYLDQSDEAGGMIVNKVSGDLLSAARLGLIFADNTQSAVIFRFSEGYNSTGKSGNTFLSGTKLGDKDVLSWNGTRAVKATDPSVTVDTYSIQVNGSTVKVPDKPLFYMEYNQIYPVDVYFYIEGCDPDCAESIYYDEVSLHLAFYGLMTEENG